MECTGFAFVAGGGSGIGKSVCLAFATGGVRGLVVADINLAAAIETAEACKKIAKSPDIKVEAVHMDVSLADSVQNAINFMVKNFGRVDYCVNAVGVLGEHSDIAESGLESFQQTMNINTQGVFLVMRAASAAMAKQEPVLIDEARPVRGLSRGAIVNIGSIASYIVLPKSLQYVASKHAVLGLSRSGALDNIKHNIRVNCVCPSWVDTPMVSHVVNEFPPLHDFILSQMPMGRMGLPEEIADVIVFLCSPKASWINGANIVVDGAMTIGVYTPAPPASADES
ncbi:hypothetical protein F5Y10DRAFT_246880 [Nemania abortiva]|nr:hypothetical protein F5Y10DRAFT_246880 [Nemania abortiva]